MQENELGGSLMSAVCAGRGLEVDGGVGVEDAEGGGDGVGGELFLGWGFDAGGEAGDDLGDRAVAVYGGD